jgi:hypothetical protein
MGIGTFLPGQITLGTEPRHGLEQLVPLLLNPLDLRGI